MGWDVFISHPSEDKNLVAVPLKQTLEKLGISVWIDTLHLRTASSTYGVMLMKPVVAGIFIVKYSVWDFMASS